ncbi:MAG TPA: LysR family transcriptional regulator [Paenibacillus sp.]|jgi:DNA-binding transcriptional LysR family regulator
MNIENLEAFVYVIHYGSFNKAADMLFLSQPSVTARIQSLERELDCKLFDRCGRQVQLTDKGKQFLPYAQQILQTYQKGKMQLQKQKALPNELRIGCTISVSNYVIPNLLPRMKLLYPDIIFKLSVGITDDIVNKTLNKELDIGFVRNISHPNLQSVKLYTDPITLYVYEGHPFIGDEQVTLEDIKQEALVFFECGALDWMQLHRVFENLDHPPNIDFMTDNLETAKKLVLNRAGICFLPSRCVSEEVAEQKLFPIYFREVSNISLQTNLVTLHGENTVIYNTMLKIGKEILSGGHSTDLERKVYM